MHPSSTILEHFKAQNSNQNDCFNGEVKMKETICQSVIAFGIFYDYLQVFCFTFESDHIELNEEIMGDI